MNSPRFNNAIAALVKGYLKGTLAKASCAACAVGNICAAAVGVDIKAHLNGNGKLAYFNWGEDLYSVWDGVFSTSDGEQDLYSSNYKGEAKRQIDATGYTVAELARIEYAFETNTQINFNLYYLRTPEEIDADQLAGLMAAVDVLCQIEGITDPAPYKAQFDKSLADIIVG